MSNHEMCFFECFELSIYQAYFGAGFLKILSIFEPQIEKHYDVYKNNSLLHSKRILGSERKVNKTLFCLVIV